MTFTTSLYPYQQAAVEKLRRTKVGALYMQPGTGKTRTALELIKRREDVGKVNAVLWLCPCSVKENLHLDITYHCGDVPRNLIIKGIESISSSDRLYLQLLEMVTTYNVFLVVDESNLVKNHKAKRTERISEISRHCSYKLILNGTPVSRNEADLFAQWYILDPDILGYKSYYSFAANHLEYWTIIDENGVEHTTDHIKRVLDIDYLTAKIAPYTFQITMEETGINLPEISYLHETCDFTPEQFAHYQEVKEMFLGNVDEFDETTIYKLFTALQLVSSGRRVLSLPKDRMRSEPFFDHWQGNPRMRCLEKIITGNIKDEQCIVFCKLQSEVDDIAQMLASHGISFSEFTGRDNLKQRVKSLKLFRSGETQFLLSNKKCGAYGLNLQFCHAIIFYHNDFEYATREQAENRIYRIGQTQTCKIYDIYVNNSIDSMICDNLRHKTSMIESFKEWIKKNQIKSVEELVKDS